MPDDQPDESGDVFDEFSLFELRAIATRLLAEGDATSRAVLREQLVEEEFAE